MEKNLITLEDRLRKYLIAEPKVVVKREDGKLILTINSDDGFEGFEEVSTMYNGGLYNLTYQGNCRAAFGTFLSPSFQHYAQISPVIRELQLEVEAINRRGRTGIYLPSTERLYSAMPYLEKIGISLDALEPALGIFALIFKEKSLSERAKRRV